MGLFGKKTAAPTGPDYWALQKVNRYINNDFRLPNGRPLADCEWFTHFKAEELKKLGAQGTKVYVRTATADPAKPGSNHVVLRVGDWILDNQEQNPYPYSNFKRRGYQEFPMPEHMQSAPIK